MSTINTYIKTGLSLLLIFVASNCYSQQSELRIELVNPNQGNYIGGTSKFQVLANFGYTIANPTTDLFEWDLPAHCHLSNYKTGLTNQFTTVGNVAEVVWDFDISPDKNFTFGIYAHYLLQPSYSVEQNGFSLNNIINCNALKSITISSVPVRYFLDFPLSKAYPVYNYTFEGDGAGSYQFGNNAMGDYVDIIWSSTAIYYGLRFKITGHYGHYEQRGPTIEFAEDATDILDFFPTSNIITHNPGYNSVVNVECGMAISGTIGETVQSPNGTIPIQSYQWQIAELGINNFENIPSETNSDFNYSIKITSSSQLRRMVTLTDGSTSFSNVITINVNFNNYALEERNLTREHTVLVPNIKNICEVLTLPIGAKLQTTTYVDGFGRTIQINDKQVSQSTTGAWKDMITYFDYKANDKYGFVSRSYLPFQSPTDNGLFLGDAEHFQKKYVQDFYQEKTTAPTYAETITDNSPLSLTKKILNPGDEWGGKEIGVSADYDINIKGDNVAILDYDPLNFTNSYPSFVGYYNDGTLYKNISKDEKNNEIITFTDFSGKLLLKRVKYGDVDWAETYYVYDDLGQLRITIPPKAVDYLIKNKFVDLAPIADELYFLNEYDYRGRIISKKQPGQKLKDASFVVYDKRNRVVATQDGVQRKTNLWGFALYDGLNREVATGNFTVPMWSTRANLQSAMDGAYYSAGFVANELNCNLLFDNSNQVFFNAVYPIVIDNNKSQLPININNIAFNSLNSYSSYSQKNVETIDYRIPTFTFPTNPSPFSDADNAAKSQRLHGLLTNQIVRVLDNSSSNIKFLRTTSYYDEKGRVMQTLADNIKDGVDVADNQYDFAGKVLSTHFSHETKSSVGVSTLFETVSLPTYDKLGRIINLKRSYNYNSGQVNKNLVSYAYDAYGRLKTKLLDPDYMNLTRLPNLPLTGMETLNYEYNINGWLTYINKDYVKSENKSTQWNNYFGLQLGYENASGEFANKQYNGQLTGVIWRSQGTNNNVKFDFTYDLLGRLTSAQYNQRTNLYGDWEFSKANSYSTYISYADKNGNIRSLLNYGRQPGNSGKVEIDNLLYDYGIKPDETNKLYKVNDRTQLTANGMFNDFVDGINTGDDYAYDENGNIIQDYNKKTTANGIEYDLVLNKPRKMTLVDGLGNLTYVEYLYDASGAKLSKAVTNAATGSTTTTYYMGNFVYEEKGGVFDLKYVLHEEGRMKMMAPSAVNGNQIIPYNTCGILKLEAGNSTDLLDVPDKLGSTTKEPDGCFEFFVKDQLGNTRMVLTEEQHKEKYTASFEQNATSSFEAEFFGQINGSTPYDQNGFDVTPVPTNPRYQNNEYVKTLFKAGPGIWPGSGASRDVCKLVAPNAKMGANQLLKVMAGDAIESKVDFAFHDNAAPYQSGGSDANNIVNTIVAALTGNYKNDFGGIVKGQQTAIGNNLLASPTYSSILNNKDAGSNTQVPYAFLNVVFFDEQFNVVSYADVYTGNKFKRVNKLVEISPGIYSGNLIINTKAPQNGYVYIYLSNESGEPVYFDDFVNTLDRSRITQESHYYPFGQKIAGLSSVVVDKEPNYYNYQGDNCEHEPETGYDEFDLRFYDPTIGRWLAADPYEEFGSPYVGMGNDPVNVTDENGGSVDNAGLTGALIGAIVGITTTSCILNKNDNHDNLQRGLWMLAGAFAVADLGYGITETWIDKDRTGTGILTNMWGFIKGTFGGSGSVYDAFYHSTTGIGRGASASSAPVPNVWGGIGNALGNIFQLIESETESINWKLVDILRYNDFYDDKGFTASPQINLNGYPVTMQEYASINYEPYNKIKIRYSLFYYTELDYSTTDGSLPTTTVQAPAINKKLEIVNSKGRVDVNMHMSANIREWLSNNGFRISQRPYGFMRIKKYEARLRRYKYLKILGIRIPLIKIFIHE